MRLDRGRGSCETAACRRGPGRRRRRGRVFRRRPLVTRRAEREALPGGRRPSPCRSSPSSAEGSSLVRSVGDPGPNADGPGSEPAPAASHGRAVGRPRPVLRVRSGHIATVSKAAEDRRGSRPESRNRVATPVRVCPFPGSRMPAGRLPEASAGRCPSGPGRCRPGLPGAVRERPSGRADQEGDSDDYR